MCSITAADHRVTDLIIQADLDAVADLVLPLAGHGEAIYNGLPLYWKPLLSAGDSP